MSPVLMLSVISFLILFLAPSSLTYGSRAAPDRWTSCSLSASGRWEAEEDAAGLLQSSTWERSSPTPRLASALGCCSCCERKSLAEPSSRDELLRLVVGSEQARSRVLSFLHSACETRHKELAGGRRSFPGTYRAALRALDAAIAASGTSDEPGVGLALFSSSSGCSRADDDLGYRLAVVEAVLFRLNLTDLVVGLPLDAGSAPRVLHFASLVEEEGSESPAALSYYRRALVSTGEGELLAGMSWLSRLLARIGADAFRSGVASYRQVPRSQGAGYSTDFAVYRLDDGRPLRLGLLADWGSGSPQALHLAREMEKQGLDMVIHLGDTYYSGTPEEARDFWLAPMRTTFSQRPTALLQVPGNHDYFSGGAGFFEVIDELGFQNASFFCLRGEHWQVLALDTGLLEDFDLLSPRRGAAPGRPIANTMTFLPEDQLQWARHQLEVGRRLGLKTILLSHHQLFSRRESLGTADGFEEGEGLAEALGVAYQTDELRVAAPAPTRSLPEGAQPAVNTRLLQQLGPELSSITAWYWGHEHASAVFEPYAGLRRGRLIGNAAIAQDRSVDVYAANEALHGEPWGGHPEVIEGSQTGRGDHYWNLGFVTLELSGRAARATHFEIQDRDHTEGASSVVWGAASPLYEEWL